MKWQIELSSSGPGRVKVRSGSGGGQEGMVKAGVSWSLRGTSKTLQRRLQRGTILCLTNQKSNNIKFIELDTIASQACFDRFSFVSDNANTCTPLVPVSLCCAGLCACPSLPSSVFLPQDLGIPPPPIHSGDQLKHSIEIKNLKLYVQVNLEKYIKCDLEPS